MLELVIIILIVFLLMYILQNHLDCSRRMSIHCLLRNVVLFCGVYLVIEKKMSVIHLVSVIVILEIAIEVLHFIGYPMDPYLNKVLNFYRWADTLWSSKHVKSAFDNYTEGKNDGDPHLTVKQSQLDKFEWMAKECKAHTKPGMRILEIGCGNGEFLKYLESVYGAKAVGLTPSPDQVALLKKRGVDVRLVDIWDIPEKHPELHHAFDAIVMNGSTEHFLNLQTGNTDKKQRALYKRMFRIVKMCIDPNSTSKRCVITAIHFHRDHSLYETMQLFLLERSYGGFYALTENMYVECARETDFTLVKKENRTMDYYIWARKIWYNVYKGMMTEPMTMLRTIIDIPAFAMNDPYYVHKILHCVMNTWSWQFNVPTNPLLASADTPPVIHLWLTLEL